MKIEYRGKEVKMLSNRMEFYTSKKWADIKRECIERATGEDGFVYDELNGEKIVGRGDIICHHMIELTDDNVDDYAVSLNPENIKVVSFRHHNEIHNRFGFQTQKKVYWVYGAPFSPSREEFLKSHVGNNDLICDITRIRSAVTKDGERNKNTDLVVFMLRDRLLDAIMTRAGSWENAYINTTKIDARMMIQLNAYPLEVSDTMDDCLKNLPPNVSPKIVFDFFSRDI